jgi:hypothetical protein
MMETDPRLKEDSSYSPSPPVSPGGESNETPEKRNLKSVLKKLEESKGEMQDRNLKTARDENTLLKAPTVEGYAARHRKFAKNFTFRRQAASVVSPEGPTASSTSTPTTTPPPPITAGAGPQEDEKRQLSRRDGSQPEQSAYRKESHHLEDSRAHLAPDILAILPQLETMSSEINQKWLSFWCC